MLKKTGSFPQRVPFETSESVPYLNDFIFLLEKKIKSKKEKFKFSCNRNISSMEGTSELFSIQTAYVLPTHPIPRDAEALRSPREDV